jgi:AraC-like DNA-binding protein
MLPTLMEVSMLVSMFVLVYQTRKVVPLAVAAALTILSAAAMVKFFSPVELAQAAQQHFGISPAELQRDVYISSLPAPEVPTP